MQMRPLTETMVADCSDFLFATELGRRYYPLRRLLDDAVEKACQRDDIFLAYEGQRLVGVLWYVEEGSFYIYPYLHMIVVDESCRGKGYGRRMLAYMEECLLEKRMTSKIYLIVTENNQAAQELYASVGYRKVGRLENLYRKGVHELLMEKFLSKMTKIGQLNAS
ncbi:GNAT family N-acetyltransferase [Evtepia sp.]|uniref:GNAT family N-acetyltransferase n=1 Tax=Evtepia sp. TaxID=2773933 RepID=UPI002A759E06|nr:GNAT family N-acetyltransferase [Evtepia sp.]